MIIICYYWIIILYIFNIYIYTLLFNNSTTLVSGHMDNNLRFWDARSGKNIKEMSDIHMGQITSVSVSPGKQNKKNKNKILMFMVYQFYIYIYVKNHLLIYNIFINVLIQMDQRYLLIPKTIH